MARDFGSHRPQLVSRTLDGDHYIECSICKWQWDIVQLGTELELRRSYRPDPNADDHDRLLDLAMEVSEDLTGICLACRQTANDGQVEPDASGYVCDWCDKPAVIGAQEYILWTVA